MAPRIAILIVVLAIVFIALSSVVFSESNPTMDNGMAVISKTPQGNQFYPSSFGARYSDKQTISLGSRIGLCLTPPEPSKRVSYTTVSFSGGNNVIRTSDFEAMVSYMGFASASIYTECYIILINEKMDLELTARIAITFTKPPERSGFYDLSTLISSTGTITANVMIYFTDGSSTSTSFSLSTRGIAVYVYELTADVRLDSIGYRAFGSLANGSYAVAPTYRASIMIRLSGPSPPPGYSYSLSGYLEYSSPLIQQPIKSDEIRIPAGGSASTSIDIPVIPGYYDRNLSIAFRASTFQYTYNIHASANAYGIAVSVSKPYGIVICNTTRCYANATAFASFYSYPRGAGSAVVTIGVSWRDGSVSCSKTLGISLESSQPINIIQCSSGINTTYRADQSVDGSSFAEISVSTPSGAQRFSDTARTRIAIISIADLVSVVKQSYMALRTIATYFLIAVVSMLIISMVVSSYIQIPFFTAFASHIASRLPMAIFLLAFIYIAPYLGAGAAVYFSRLLGYSYNVSPGSPDDVLASTLANYLSGIVLAKAIYQSMIADANTKLGLVLLIPAIYLAIGAVITIFNPGASALLRNSIASLFSALSLIASMMLTIVSMDAAFKIVSAISQMLIPGVFLLATLIIVMGVILTIVSPRIPGWIANFIGLSILALLIVPALSFLPIVLYNQLTMIESSIRSTLVAAVENPVAILLAAAGVNVIYAAIAQIFIVSGFTLAMIMIAVTLAPIIIILLSSGIYSEIGRTIQRIIMGA